MERSGASRAYVNVHYDEKSKTNTVGVAQPTCWAPATVSPAATSARRRRCASRTADREVIRRADLHAVRRPSSRATRRWRVGSALPAARDRQRIGSGRQGAAREDRGARRGCDGLQPGILLRSQELGLPLAAESQCRLGGNGDAFALAYDGNDQLDSVGVGRNTELEHPVGATITGVIDHRDPEQPVEDGIVVEEGAFPSGLATLLRKSLALGTIFLGRDWLRGLWAKLKDLFGFEVEEGALDRTLLFLLMGHDGADGLVQLDKRGRSTVSWSDLKKRKVFSAEDMKAKTITKAPGGEFISDPL